jgi:type II secretory pathway component PulJ
MFGAEIPDPLLYGLVPVTFTMVVALIAWIVRELSRTSALLGRHEERIDGLEDRIAWMGEERRHADRRHPDG